MVLMNCHDAVSIVYLAQSKGSINQHVIEKHKY